MVDVIKPYYIIEGVGTDSNVDGKKILLVLEKKARISHKSEERIKEGSAERLIKSCLNADPIEDNPLEHITVSVLVVCDRGVSHEVVRHRIATFTQESTRYCNYKSRGVKVINPFFFKKDSKKKKVLVPKFTTDEKLFSYNELEMNEFDVWLMAMMFSEWAYNTLIVEFGRTPQEARTVLPNSLKTEFSMTLNLVSWRNFFRKRANKKAHPQMRELAVPLLKDFKRLIPIIFDDIPEE